MKRQVGRCTAVYESERFPFFTINANTRRNIESSNHGGIVAFFARLKFVKAHRALLDLLGVEVTPDCEFLCQDEDSIDALRYWLLLEFENELLGVEDPRVTTWETFPLSFIPFDPISNDMVRALTGGLRDETL